jgi:hypothetical protein
MVYFKLIYKHSFGIVCWDDFFEFIVGQNNEILSFDSDLQVYFFLLYLYNF